MADSSFPPQGGSTGSMSSSSSPQIPKEVKMASSLLTSCGIEECEPKVIQQILEFMYRYTTDILQESLVYSQHAGKGEVDLEDLRLGIRMKSKNLFTPPPSRDFLMELASRKNSIPLPLLDDKLGLRLPADKHTLLGAHYRITSQRRNMGPTPMNIVSPPPPQYQHQPLSPQKRQAPPQHTE